jgi:hypothetical protein
MTVPGGKQKQREPVLHEVLSHESSFNYGDMDSKSRKILLPLLLAKNDPWIKKQTVQMHNSSRRRQVPIK